MVKIRLQKLGRRNRAFFRIVVMDVRVKRQGTYLEKLGHYDPIEKDFDKQVVCNTERVQHWIKQGAQQSEAVARLLRKRTGKAPVAAAPKAEAAVAAK